MKISFKIKFVVFLILLLLFISTFKSTYAKYASTASGTATASVANWEILVNNSDINASSFTTASLTPSLDTNTNVASGKIAPGSAGHIDAIVDVTKVDVAFTLGITLNNTGSNVSDFKIKSVYVYSLNSSGGVVSTLKSYVPTVPQSTYSIAASDLIFKMHSSTTSTVSYHQYNTTTSSAFQKIKITVNVVWDDTSSGTGNDSADTTIGHNAVTSTQVGKINATLQFNQYTG